MIPTQRSAPRGVAAGLLLIAVFAAGAAQAQAGNAGAMADKYAANARDNAMLMRHYTWQMRVSVTYKDKPEAPSLYQMNWAPDGTLQKTRLSAPPKEPSGRGIRGRIKKGKIEDFEKWLGELADLVKKYMAPTPGTMMDFYSKATFTASPDGAVAVSAPAFMQPGDRATFYVNQKTNKPERYTFTTVLEGDPVTGTVNYGQVTGGPQYAEQITVAVPAKEVTAVINNFNFIKQ
ncbi:MAG: hypothetical protein ACHQ2E_07545 [Gemmatimonadales bacterium]